ncbi:MAG: BrnT family toxin [Erysipelotrichaceae bacterium]|nr:BrnT family toxin [Erysipelotrichaceae bacterium]
MGFEWDPRKNAINIKKHSVSFEEAITVFFDDDAIKFDDPDHSEEEERFLMLGFSSKARILIVCHCFRAENRTIRIISARKATEEEEKTYNELKRGW